jgi:hypothetical protein
MSLLGDAKPIVAGIDGLEVSERHPLPRRGLLRFDDVLITDWVYALMKPGTTTQSVSRRAPIAVEGGCKKGRKMHFSRVCPTERVHLQKLLIHPMV